MHALLHSAPPTLQQATAYPCLCWRLLYTHRQVWVSLLWGHCSSLLGPGVNKVLFVACKSLFPQSHVSSGGSMVRIMVTSSKRGLCHTPVCCTQSPCPCGSPLLTCTSTGDTQTQFCLSLCGVSGFWCAQGLFECSERLWQIWSLVLNAILPLLPSCWGFSFAWAWVYLLIAMLHSCYSTCSIVRQNFSLQFSMFLDGYSYKLTFIDLNIYKTSIKYHSYKL